MSQTTFGFEQDLRISSRPVILMIILAGILVFTLSMYMPDLSRTIAVALFSLILVTLAIVTWFLERTRPLVARWFTVILLSLALFFPALWFNIPFATVLVFLPVGLAAALISLPACAISAAIQTVLILILLSVRREMPPAFFWFLLLEIWSTFGLMVSVYRPVIQVAYWAWDFFNSTNDSPAKSSG